MRLLAGWDSLDPSLVRILRLNLWALTISFAILTLVYAAGYRHTSVLVDLIALAVALAVMLGTVPLTDRFGAGVVVLGMTVGATVFALGATWQTPYLSPLVAMLMLLPLLVGVAHLSSRFINVLMVYAVIGGAALAAISEWRRDSLDDTWLSGSIAIGLSLPTVSIVVVYLVRDAFRRLTHQSEQLREASQRMVEVADAARQAIERDLHDGAQQHLLAMSVTIERARMEIGAGRTENATELLHQLATDNRDVTNQLRELARGIYPPLLAERGLVAALQSAARSSLLPVTLRSDLAERLPASVENPAYFCILEALTNAIKHSRATGVVITLRANPGLEFFVADDGRGFDPGAVRARGLVGMQARMDAAGGELAILSGPGEGTTLHGRFPWAP